MSQTTMTPSPEEMEAHLYRQALIGRDLDDVYLLLDHLSGRVDRSISTLTILNAAHEPVGLVEAVCAIRWPPPAGADADRAPDAAALFKARDVLNQMAYPASSVSVAFTIMVTYVAAAPGLLAPVLRRLAGGKPPPPPGEAIRSSGARRNLAERAYPDLIAQARSLRIWIRVYLGVLLLGLALTASVSWNVASGKLILDRVNELKLRAAAEAAQLVGVVLSAGENTRAAAAEEAPDAGATYDAMCTAPGAASAAALGKDAHAETGTRTGGLCGKSQAIRMQRMAADRSLQTWFSTWEAGLRWIGLGAALPELADATADYRTQVAQAAPVEQRAGDVVTVLSAYVLPMLYGFLGATAAVIRSLHAKMRFSLLTPRDIRTSQVQLALGIIVGACIGLFISPGSSPDQHLPSISLAGAAVSLSASALSFVAGFGVEAVFKWLESIITTLFHTDSSYALPKEGQQQAPAPLLPPRLGGGQPNPVPPPKPAPVQPVPVQAGAASASLDDRNATTATS